MRGMGRRCVGQEWSRWSMISYRGYRKSTTELLCFNFLLKPPSCLGHKLAHPYNSNWLYEFFTPLDCATVLNFKTCFSCGQQKVNQKEQYSSECIFGLQLITLLEYICTKLFLLYFYGHSQIQVSDEKLHH